ncbi:MAG: CoA-binding protein [Nitrospira sp.]|nr:CoA-binding protein [Nitrospira sp.]
MSRSSAESGSASLKAFFYPYTIALVGATREETGIGHRILESLQNGGFTGSVIPVNPHATEIAGLRTFPSLRDIPSPVDLAIIAVPAGLALSIIDDCAAKQIPAAIVITAGFSETGDIGTSLEEQLRERVHRYGIRLIGPNCFGLMNLDPAIRLNATYTPIIPPAGRVALASESGGLGLAVVTAA